MKIRFVFHNPKGERGVGKAIVGWTWILGCFYNWKVLKYNFSHVELWIPDGANCFQWPMPISKQIGLPDNCFRGECFSSTTRGKWNGVRFAPAIEVIGKHPERWSYIECEVDADRLEVALDEATLRVGLKYDFWALFGFFNPFAVQDSKKWYCSEICNWFGALCRVCKRDKRISPRRFCYVLAKRWHELKPV